MCYPWGVCYGRHAIYPLPVLKLSMHKIYIVSGMTCSHCVASVTEEVSEVAGVGEVDIDLESGRVVVTGISIDDAGVRAAVEQAGYEVVIREDTR